MDTNPIKNSNRFAKWGPWMVGLGAALWGTETVWRTQLNLEGRFNPEPIVFLAWRDLFMSEGRFYSEVIVFYEHAFIMLAMIPILLFYAISRREKIRAIPRSAYAYLTLSGVAGSAIGTVFFTAALAHWDPSQANVLLSIQPIFSTVIAYFLFKDRLSKNFIPWAMLAILAGVALSIKDPSVFFAKSKVSFLSPGLIYTLTCAVSWGLATVAGRGVMVHMPTPFAVALRYTVGLATLVVILLFRGKLNLASLQPQAMFQTRPLLMMLGLVTISGGIPSFFYFWGLKNTKVSTAGYFEMFQTLAALLVTWGIPAWFPVLGLMVSPLNWHQLLAGGILVFAAVQIQRAQEKLQTIQPQGKA